MRILRQRVLHFYTATRFTSLPLPTNQLILAVKWM